MACNGVVNAMRVVSFTCRVMITDAILSLFCHSYNTIFLYCSFTPIDTVPPQARALYAVFRKYDDIATLRAYMRKRRRKDATESSAGQEPESIV